MGSEGSRVEGMLHIVEDIPFGADLVGFTTLMNDGSDICIVFGGGSPGNLAIFVILDKDPEMKSRTLILTHICFFFSRSSVNI